MAKHIVAPTTPFQHPEQKTTVANFKNLVNAISNADKAQETAKKYENTVTIGSGPSWTTNTQFIARYKDAETIPIADMVDIVRKSREMTLAVMDRASDFADVYRPTEPIKIPDSYIPDIEKLTGISTATVAPDMFDCILRKASVPPYTANDISARLSSESKQSDLIAKDLLNVAGNLVGKYTLNFGLIFLLLLFRLILKFIINKVFGVFCIIASAIPVVGNDIKKGIDSVVTRLFKLKRSEGPCNSTFDLAEEMKAKVVQKMLKPPYEQPSIDELYDFSDEQYSTDSLCSEAAIANTSLEDQARARQIVGAVLASDTSDNTKLNTIDDVLKYKDTFTSPGPNSGILGGTGKNELGIEGKSAGGWTEMTIAQRIKAQGSSYVMAMDRIEHKLTQPDGKPVEGKIKTAIYSVIMNLNIDMKAADQTISAWVHMNTDNRKGAFSLPGWICCAIRTLFVIIVANNKNLAGKTLIDQFSEADRVNTLRYMERGVGYTIDNAEWLKNWLGEEALKKIQVFAALFDAVLSRLLGSVTFSSKITDLEDFLLKYGMNAFGELNQMLMELLGMLMSTVVDLIDSYLIDVYKVPQVREAIAVCSPIDQLFNIMLCGINALQTQAFKLIVLQWEKTNTMAQNFEMMFNISMQYKSITFFSDLLKFVLHADELVRNICGLSHTMSDLEQASSLEQARKKLGLREIDEDIQQRLETIPVDKRSQALADLRSKIDKVKTPIYDPNVQLGPQGFIENQMFRNKIWGGNSFSIGSSPIYGGTGDIEPNVLEKPDLQAPTLHQTMVSCSADFGNKYRQMMEELAESKDRFFG